MITSLVSEVPPLIMLLILDSPSSVAARLFGTFKLTRRRAGPEALAPHSAHLSLLESVCVWVGVGASEASGHHHIVVCNV